MKRFSGAPVNPWRARREATIDRKSPGSAKSSCWGASKVDRVGEGKCSEDSLGTGKKRRRQERFLPMPSLGTIIFPLSAASHRSCHSHQGRWRKR